MTTPRAHIRRSPLARAREYAAARWTALGDVAIAETVAHSGSADVRLSIADLSPLPRLGFKGRGTIDAMRKRGIAVEAAPNRAFRQPDGGLCLVLAPGEVILLSNLAGEGSKLDRWLTDWRLDDEERTYPLLRRDSHAWFAVTGEAAPQMFAKICAIDLRPHKFADLTIAQTSVAKMTAIVARADTGSRPTYHVLADTAAALYFCHALLDAAGEYGGRLVGRSELQDA